MIRVGIIGGAGYTAGELIRLLVNHPRPASPSFILRATPAGMSMKSTKAYTATPT